MIKIENVEVVGWEATLRGMRNPKNSWDRSDSFECDGTVPIFEGCDDCPMNPGVDTIEIRSFSKLPKCKRENMTHVVGPNDHKLAMSLADGGPVHAKYRRMIDVYMDITAPLYWWKEFDTYKVGTVANSCSTMHKIHDKEFTLEDFSHEHLIDPFEGLDEDAKDKKVWEITRDIKFEDIRLGGHTIFTSAKKGILAICSRWLGDSPETQNALKSVYGPKAILENFVIPSLNANREAYLETKDKKYWWQMIQLLPSSYNQRRTIKLNYEVLTGIYEWRRNHKLDEWRDFCTWIEELPYSEIITGPSLNDIPIAHEIMDEAKRRVLDGTWSLETDEDMSNPMFKLVVCSVCNEKANNTYSYCPNCGAKMDGGIE